MRPYSDVLFLFSSSFDIPVDLAKRKKKAYLFVPVLQSEGLRKEMNAWMREMEWELELSTYWKGRK